MYVLLGFWGKIYGLYRKRDRFGFLVPLSCLMYMASTLFSYLEINGSLNEMLLNRVMDLVDTVCGRMRLNCLIEQALFLSSEAGKGLLLNFGREVKMMRWVVNSVKG